VAPDGRADLTDKGAAQREQPGKEHQQEYKVAANQETLRMKLGTERLREAEDDAASQCTPK
jgi:hypothetical protein